MNRFGEEASVVPNNISARLHISPEHEFLNLQLKTGGTCYNLRYL